MDKSSSKLLVIFNISVVHDGILQIIKVLWIDLEFQSDFLHLVLECTMNTVHQCLRVISLSQ